MKITRHGILSLNLACLHRSNFEKILHYPTINGRVDGYSGENDSDEEKNTDQVCRPLWDRECPLCSSRMEYIGEIKYISQFPKEIRSLDYDHKEGKRIKTTFCRDEIAWYCSPLMFELESDDPKYKRLHENDFK